MLTEQQKLDRNNGIGGSDMPIILGLSPYKTPYQLYLEKKGLLDPYTEETQPQYWGHQLEPMIREEFAKRNLVSIETPIDTKVHPLFPFLRGNLDGWIPEWNSILEIKTCSAYSAQDWGESGSDVIPLHYLVQVAFYCAVMNCEVAHIAVLIGGNDYREYKYTRNLEVETKIINAACDFWEAVEGDKPEPPPFNIDDLKLMFPQHKEKKKKQINDEIASHLEMLSLSKYQIKANKETEEKSKFEVMKFMEDAELLIDEFENTVASWKTNKKGIRTFLIKNSLDK